MKLPEQLTENWKTWSTLTLMVAAVLTFLSWKTTADEAVSGYAYAAESAEKTEKKVQAIEQSFEQIAVIAQGFQSEPTLLYEHLMTYRHQIDADTTQLREWSKWPQGPKLDSLGAPLRGINYLDARVLPDIGIQMVTKMSGQTKVIDTLWVIRRRSN